MLFRVRFDALEESSLGVHLRGQFYLPRNDGFIVAVDRDTKMIIKSDWKEAHINASTFHPREMMICSNDDDCSVLPHDGNGGRVRYSTCWSYLEIHDVLFR